MALVDYDSEDDDLELDSKVCSGTSPSVQPTDTRKRKLSNDNPISDLPPIPSKFHDLYASTIRVSTKDDPALHGGRQRVTPHVEGNWPTHVYIEWYPSKTEYEYLTNLITALKASTPNEEIIHSLLVSDLGVPLPLHVSLSQPVGFSTEQKDAFLHSLQEAYKASGVRPFDMRFSALDWVPNYSHTRYFLVLRLLKPASNALNKLLHVSNTIVTEHGQLALYVPSFRPPPEKEPPSKRRVSRSLETRQRDNINWSTMKDVDDAFHVSLAWTLKAPSEELKSKTEEIWGKYEGDVKRVKARTDQVKVKIGNVVTGIELQSLVGERKGLFGV